MPKFTVYVKLFTYTEEGEAQQTAEALRGQGVNAFWLCEEQEREVDYAEARS